MGLAGCKEYFENLRRLIVLLFDYANTLKPIADLTPNEKVFSLHKISKNIAENEVEFIISEETDTKDKNKHLLLLLVQVFNCFFKSESTFPQVCASLSFGLTLMLVMDIFRSYNLTLQISIIHNCVSQFALLVVAYHTVHNTEMVSTILLPSGHYFHREKPVIIIEQCEDKQIILLESRIEFVFTVFHSRFLRIHSHLIDVIFEK